ncbi:MAG: hypothetical protein Q8L40_11220 [Burkholderiales bacterium]|nr:hypothetical protein [Burkholderiales bacterium]
MHILFTDETNVVPAANAKFFAYGGLIVEVSKLDALHAGVNAIGQNAGYKPGDELKFDTHARPQHVSVNAATIAKQQIIQLCIDLGCKFIVYVVLHAIAKKDPATLVRWGADHVIGKFNYFLTVLGSHGMVAVDRLPNGNEFSFLTDKFCHGLTFPDTGEKVPLDRIRLFSSTCMNASHASSAMDVVLGSFRYCINQPYNEDAARQMMKQISNLIWCTRDNDTIYPFERGLIFRPKNVTHPPYKQEYDQLLNYINILLAENNAR